MWKITIHNRVMMLLSVILILMVGSEIGAAADITVHDGESIQAAVDNATMGDTIIVEPGTYTGNITINTDGLVITGNSKNTIIQGDGFYLTGDAQGITIKGFTLQGTNNSYGIRLDEYANGTIENNTILNYDTAIDTNIYSTFAINKNAISNCGYGVYIGECYNAVVTNNQISSCGTGIVVGDLGDSQIENNVLTNNDNGIALMYGGRSTIVSNAISSSKKYGLYDNAYGGSTIYNNYFNNTENLKFGEEHTSPNTWNTTKTTGKNIIGGSYQGGNYWAQPDGAGFSQTHSDTDGDGIADEGASFNDNDVDHAALVSSSGTVVTPELSSETSAENLTETQNGAQTETSTDTLTETQSETQTETSTDTLTETQSGTQTETSTENLTDTGNETQTDESTEDTEDSDSSSSGSSHHSSGSSGGSIGGSSEPQENVAAKDTAKVFISSGEPVYFNFTNNVTVVDFISFESKKTLGQTTAIVENLKNKSELVTELPEGVVYKSFNVWVGNGDYGDSDNILNATLGFRVEKSWISENNINQSSIVLYKYDDEKKEWVKLPVNLVSEDNQFLHFTANVPGYSSFVIIGEHAAQVAETKQTVSSNESDNASKAPVEKTKLPGFGIVTGLVCLICAIKRKRR